MCKTPINIRRVIPLLILSFWLISLSPQQAGAQIVVSGANAATSNLFTSWYTNHVATPFQARARVKVQALDDVQMAAFLGTDGTNKDANFKGDSPNQADLSDVDGVFENDPPRIVLRISTQSPPDMFTFVHEYGHYVWFNLFSREDRKQYETIYKHQRDIGHLVTRYAATDLEEGFAEAFSFYANEPAMLMRRDPASANFLKNWAAAHQKPTEH